MGRKGRFRHFYINGYTPPGQRHSAGDQQGQPPPPFVPQEVPELWRKHARQPWKVIFPDLDWPTPEE